MSRVGPLLRIDASCYGCVHERSESYRAQGDSGHNVSCVHPAGTRYVGDTTWKTPSWCPLYAEALERLLAESKP